MIQAEYGKKITGRLALRLSGGPEISNFRLPENSGTGTQYIDGTGSASLSYAFSAGSASLSFNHGVNNGSGVLLGATSDQVIGGANRKLTRVWRGNVMSRLLAERKSSRIKYKSQPNIQYCLYRRRLAAAT